MFEIALTPGRSRRNGNASGTTTPDPMASTAATMRPRRASSRSAIVTMRMFGVALGEARRSAMAMARSSLDVLGLRRHTALQGCADVVQLQPQMIFRRDHSRTIQVGFVGQQRNNVAGSGRRNRLMEPRQRTYVDHYTFLFRDPSSAGQSVTDSNDRFVSGLLSPPVTYLSRLRRGMEAATIGGTQGRAPRRALAMLLNLLEDH